MNLLGVVVLRDEVCAHSTRVYLIPEERCFVTGLWADARGQKKESGRSKSIRTTARIINNKGIGTEIDGCTMTDVPSINPLRSPSEGLTEIPSSCFSHLLSSSDLLVAALSRYYRASSYYPTCPSSSERDYLPRFQLFSSSSQDDYSISESSYLTFIY